MTHFCPRCGSDRINPRQKHHDGRVRYGCKTCGFRTLRPRTQALQPSPPEQKPSSTRYVITSAQNNTDLHAPFWASLLSYCRHNAAQLLVIPARYKNPDSFHDGADAEMEWPADILPYRTDNNIYLSKHLAIMASIKINATAVNPLSGLDVLSGKRSAIYGHAQLQMRMVATPHGEYPRMLHTTGSVSVPNYSRSKQGSIANFHHTIGALVVEISGDAFWVRELLADKTGGFYDLDTYYHLDAVDPGHRAAAIVFGDEHRKFMPEDVIEARWGAQGSVTVLRPEVLVRHDVHDHYSQSHHHEGDTILKVQKAHAGDWLVRDELELTLTHLVETTPDDAISYVVESNHHDHVRKWINRYNPERDPHNALFAWKLCGDIARAIESGEDCDPFRVFLRCNLPDSHKDRIRFAGPNDALIIRGVDCSQHGDRGPNGSRPSDAGFARSGYKTIRGHRHTPGIEKGAWTVGASMRSMPYAKGLSSWMTTDAVIYQNGKRALLHMIDGRWHG